MGVKKRPKHSQKKKSGPKTRKELRKDKRLLKKVHRKEFYCKKSVGKDETAPQKLNKNKEIKKNNKKVQKLKTPSDLVAKEQQKERNQKKQLELEMKKNRKKQLMEANDAEDRVIKQLEKQLGLNKKKSKGIPKSFTEDGLDYLLEMCDKDVMKNVATAEKNFIDNSGDEFEEDFAIATGKTTQRTKKLDKTESLSENDSDENSENSGIIEPPKKKQKKLIKQTKLVEENSEDELSEISASFSGNESEMDAEISENESEMDNDSEESVSKTDAKSNEWEDIYGRKRDTKGNVVTEIEPKKYIPPALRNQLSNKDLEQQIKLKRLLKGHLNRLTEHNLISIGQQIEVLYTNGSYSRNILNTTLCELINISVVENNALTPTQTVADHALLIALLHANIDIEIGANYLQNIIEKFDKLLRLAEEGKKLDNCVHIISQLYNLKLFHCGLIHDLLRRLLGNGLSERNVEAILLMLKTLGPTLRKDDPIALKNSLVYIQGVISDAPDDVKQSSRLKFMSDILMAIKNNNFSKIPNFNSETIEHLRKVLRGAIRKGNYVTQLNIALDDLLNVEQRGKWWVVGSAWTGKTIEPTKQETTNKTEFNEQILQLARKQRMNTDIRRNIFCILMTAEDYLDAFEKLLHLSLRGQQDREIVHVITHCCLQEKSYNPYYAILAQKFCEYNRKYQISFQCSIWDKLKELSNFPANKITNLSKFLTFNLVNGSLPLSTLKVIELSELDKSTVRFLRQTLLGVLLNEDLESSGHVWQRAGGNANFKQALRLFLHHFILKGKALEGLNVSEQELLKDRVKIAEKMLLVNEKRVVF